MIEYPLEVAQQKADEKRIMARALIRFEELIGHLRSCADCYEAQCTSTHILVKAAQRDTEQARKIAHEVAG